MKTKLIALMALSLAGPVFALDSLPGSSHSPEHSPDYHGLTAPEIIIDEVADFSPVDIPEMTLEITAPEPLPAVWFSFETDTPEDVPGPLTVDFVTFIEPTKPRMAFILSALICRPRLC